MKKSLMLASLALIGGTTSAQADTLAGLYVGAQGWNMETTGGYAEDADLVTFNFDDETTSSFYVALEHPVPLLPNIKLVRTDMDTSGDVLLQSSFTFGGQIFPVDTTVNSTVELTSTDFILYYEVFDNDLISFDFGLNGKYVDGTLFVRESGDNTRSGIEEFSGVVPMLYSRLALGMPFTGFGAYVEGSFLAVDDSTLSDYQAAVTYSLMDNLAIDMTFQVGYRAVTLELDDLDSVYSDLDFKGVFAGLEVHF